MLPRCTSRSVDPVDPGDTEELVEDTTLFLKDLTVLMAYLSI